MVQNPPWQLVEQQSVPVAQVPPTSVHAAAAHPPSTQWLLLQSVLTVQVAPGGTPKTFEVQTPLAQEPAQQGKFGSQTSPAPPPEVAWQLPAPPSLTVQVLLQHSALPAQRSPVGWQ